MARMFFRDIMQNHRQRSANQELKTFKTSTGSPILYTRFKKHRGVYYPLANRHYQSSKVKTKQNHKHACVIYSKTYGREMYSNIDIWPEDEHAKEKLLQKLQALSMEEEEEENDVGIDIPRALDEMNDNMVEHRHSTEHGTRSKSPNGTRHVTIVVTDASEEEEEEEDEEEERTGPTSGEHSPLPHPDRPQSPPSEEGTWPLKRSQSIDSRDNPFLPGGNLSLEADEILSKATIIRDTFILKGEGSAQPRKDNTHQDESNQPSDSFPRENSGRHNGNHCISQSPVSERMTQNETVKTECAMVQNDVSPSPTKTRPKENGQVESENSLSPGSVTLEMPGDNKDKKKQKKCCTVM